MSKNNYLQQVSDKETEIIVSLAEECFGEGDFCEFGCYRGDTSLLLEKLMEKHNRNNPNSKQFLWIYDSFEGLPPKTHEDYSAAGDEFQAGELLVTKREVVDRFKKAGLKIPRIRKAFFNQLDTGPESNDLPEKIAFAFLDGDLYDSIKDSLHIVFPRLTEHATLIVHDYNNAQLPGVTKAVDEWLTAIHAVQKISLTFSVRETLAIIKLSSTS